MLMLRGPTGKLWCVARRQISGPAVKRRPEYHVIWRDLIPPELSVVVKLPFHRVPARLSHG